MSERTAAWIAWPLCVVSVLAGGPGLTWLAWRSGQLPVYWAELPGTAALLAIAVVGAFVASRRPANPLGWIFTAAGLFFAVPSFGAVYGVDAQAVRGSLPAAEIVAWTSSWLWMPAVALLFVFPLLLFPDGRLPAPRWRGVAWSAGAANLALVFSSAVVTWPYRDAMGSQDGPALPASYERFSIGMFVILGLTTVAAAFSVFWRLRRASGDGRQQLKWFSFAAVVALFGFVGVFFADLSAANALIAGLPVAMGVAILKYRLYDIDRIISRTVSYALLTTGLGAMYVAGVALLAPLMGDSDLAVAGSTLTVAALFGPARRRLQAGVDRRFNRARYDARETVAAFSARLRDEVDLDTLRGDMLAVVGETIAPERIALWLRTDQS